MAATKFLGAAFIVFLIVDLAFAAKALVLSVLIKNPLSIRLWLIGDAATNVPFGKT